MNPQPYESDAWSEWLLHHRHGGDEGIAHAIQAQTSNFASRVIDGAQIGPGMTLVDVGTGDGLVAFLAIKRIGPSLDVVLTDISDPLLMHAEQRARELGVSDQCRFTSCPADRLEGIGNASADAVTSRAVLAYVDDKAGAMHEFFRVLKPGGRISICEPVMRYEALEIFALKTMIDTQKARSTDRLTELLCRIRAGQFPHTVEEIMRNPMTNFGEQDLVRIAEGAGFTDVQMKLEVEVLPASVTNWQAFLESSPHPLAPPVRQLIAERLTDEECRYLEERFRPLIESAQSKSTSRNVYLTARKARGSGATQG